VTAYRKEIAFEFVESIPRDLRPDTLFISIQYRTTAHLCMCGCGLKVAHPLRPNRWSLSYDGSSVSMTPSIANDGLPCNSHYWIRSSRVDWYQPLTPRQVKNARLRDAAQPVSGDVKHANPKDVQDDVAQSLTMPAGRMANAIRDRCEALKAAMRWNR
jgi:hypothetical protein